MLIEPFTVAILLFVVLVIGCFIGAIAAVKWQIEADMVTTIASSGAMMGLPGRPRPSSFPTEVIYGPGVPSTRALRGMIDPAHGMYQYPPPCGSTEAEFQNDFIQVFPMHHLEPMPEKNTTYLLRHE